MFLLDFVVTNLLFSSTSTLLCCLYNHQLNMITITCAVYDIFYYYNHVELSHVSIDGLYAREKGER